MKIYFEIYNPNEKLPKNGEYCIIKPKNENKLERLKFSEGTHPIESAFGDFWPDENYYFIDDVEWWMYSDISKNK